jgi:hypothetical protein
MSIKIYRKGDALVADMTDIAGGWEQSFLLLSDVHYDSIHADRTLLKRHLDEAKEKDARIFIFGDFFDAMGGKYDPRSTKADIRPEYQHTNYFQAIVQDAAKFLLPYKDNIALISDGNHETSVLLRHEISLLDDLAERLGGVERGKYSGFIRFKFNRGTSRMSKVMFYSHGSGGNSPVTKGVIGTARRQDNIHADFFVSGHLHSEWDMPRTQTRLNEQNNVEIHKVHHWQLGTYQQSHLKGGWADAKGFAAPSIGGRWLTFKYFADKIKSISYVAD